MSSHSVLGRFPDPSRLETAIAQAKVLTPDLQYAHSVVKSTLKPSRDPIVERGFFAEAVRQTIAVDLSELMETRPARKQRVKSSRQRSRWVDKAVALTMVEHLEAAAADEVERIQEMWAIAPDERGASCVANE